MSEHIQSIQVTYKSSALRAIEDFYLPLLQMQRTQLQLNLTDCTKFHYPEEHLQRTQKDFSQ